MAALEASTTSSLDKVAQPSNLSLKKLEIDLQSTTITVWLQTIACWSWNRFICALGLNQEIRISNKFRTRVNSTTNKMLLALWEICTMCSLIMMQPARTRALPVALLATEATIYVVWEVQPPKRRLVANLSISEKMMMKHRQIFAII